MAIFVFFRHAKPFGINNRFFATSQSIFQIIRNAWAEESTITARNIAVGFSDDRLEASHRDPKWPPLSRDQTSRPWLDYATANSSANGGRFMANSHRRNGPRICTIGSQSPFPLISHRPGRETRIMAEKLGLWPRNSDYDREARSGFKARRFIECCMAKLSAGVHATNAQSMNAEYFCHLDIDARWMLHACCKK